MTTIELVFSVWAALHPAAPRQAHAAEIANAISYAVEHDASHVWGHDEDAAVLAAYALAESWLNPGAVGDGGRSWGVWQQRRAVGGADVQTQAVGALRHMHEGQAVCPESPAAPFSGGCVEARTVADRRVRRALGILSRLH